MPSLSNLWGRIKSADLGQFFPKQQGGELGRVGDVYAAQPYGIYANLPNGQMYKVLDEDGQVVMGITVERPPNVEQNEVSIWHPSTGARIHFKNNGDLNIDTAVDTKGDVNINTVNANITASDDVDVTCNNATVNATLKADVNSNTSTVTCITSLALIAPITTVDSTTSMTFTTPLAAFIGNLSVSGTLLNAGVNVGSTHTHTQANDSGGNTESDTGVPQ